MLYISPLLQVALLTVFFACSGDGQADRPADAGLVADAALSTACQERADILQSALNAVTKSNGAALGVATLDCPPLSLVSGSIVRTDSLLRLASVTKTYVAAATVSLSRGGEISLDDTLDAWDLPVPNASGITVRQLLQHTSGLFDYTRDPVFADPSGWSVPHSPEELIAIAMSHDPQFAPGTSWAYSNTNYILLGLLLEKETEQNIAQILRERTLIPAELSQTFLDGEEELQGIMAPGYSSNGTEVTNRFHPSWAWTAGAMVGTVGEAAQWIDALYAGDILDATGRDLLTSDPQSIGGGMHYGLGTMIVPAASSGGAGRGIGHGGDISGYHSLAFYFPEKDTTIVAIVNSDAADPNVPFVAALETLF